MPVPTGGPPILDVHAHLLADPPGDFRAAVTNALKVMDQFAIARTVIMAPPQPPGFRNGYDYDAFLPAIRPHATRFAFLGGGALLNGLVHGTPAERVGSGALRTFEEAAERILAAGAAGFGELAVHHVSYFAQHPYESVPADHPLLLLLADIAARHDVPIDLHLDPIPADMPPPPRIAGGNNPRTLAANISRFELLLAHNRKTKIVWAHAGRDTLGTWSITLTRRLLEAHSNLYLSLSMHPPGGLVVENSLMGPEGSPNDRWIALLADFPDRATVGSDFFHQPTGRSAATLPPPTPGIRRFVNALPEALAKKVASENAARLYRLQLG
ncbi:MAG: hypothetical protein FJX65_14455 [Alphaproteobacteria bacterium]|nr:hypothetical protein [Alphaproteobacteria bacterium]